MNSTVSSGTPRTVSMTATQAALITGRFERRPRARNTAAGRPPTTVPMNRIRVSGRPPHWLVSTGASPNTPPNWRTSTTPRATTQATNSRYDHNRRKPEATAIPTMVTITTTPRQCSS